MRIETVRRKLEGQQLPPGIKFYTRLGVFKNSRETMGFDPVRLSGHSYRWWSMVRKVRGKVLLNTFGYSNQTSKHIGKMHRILGILGIPYRTVKAPDGLQDLATAVRHSVYELACLEVANRHARKGPRRDWAGHAKALKVLRSVGYSVPRGLKAEMIKSAETAREYRLERQRKRRAELKARASVKFIDAQPGDEGKAGLHHIGHMSDWERSKLIDQALQKGYDQVWIHKPGLRLVSA